ncbi:hypothetical protein [Nocardia wallacei]|uniref:hypothetical protein n=1 Tax=Nocardia wallacei TaxID=480035 RepID=UPI002458D3F5|nr:hypothetical protein [Nocardia wallacei]
MKFWVGGNFISPAYYISQVLEKLTGMDVFEWTSSQVAGDWEAVRRAADAAGNLSRFNTAYHDTVKGDWKNTVAESWHGNAAGSAQSYFDNLAGAVKFQVRSLEQMEHHLTKIANSMSDLTTALGDMLQELVDLAIVAAIEAAVASAGPEPITKTAAIAALALSVVRIGLVINRMWSKIGIIYIAVTGMGSAALHLVSQTTPQSLPPLPQSTYDHPGV